MTFADRSFMEDRANKIFTTIKEFERRFPDEFEKCDIKRCDRCEGTGIADRHQMNFCNHCGGIGYKGFEKIDGEFVCRTCNGFGCDACKKEGTVDWIKHANGSDITKGKWVL